MEPVTHFLTGACMARAGFTRKTALATMTMVLAAEAPDIDVVWYLGGSSVGFAHHRGFTHTFLGVPCVAALTLLLVYLWHRFRHRNIPADQHRPAQESAPPAVRWGLLYGLACVACLAHILLDYTNNYGVRPFWPFSPKWYSWDIVFIIEPLILVVLIAGLTLPALFSLVNEEIGARRKGPRGRVGAILALAAIVAIWGFRDYEHRRAINALEALMYQNAPPLRVAAYPYHTNPFVWHGVVETDAFYETLRVDSSRPEVDPNGRALVFYKPEDSDVIKAAKETYLGRAYFDWAAFPVIETEKHDSGQLSYTVRLRDLRFAYPERRQTPLSAFIMLDGNLHFERGGFRSTNPLKDRLEAESPSQDR